jgi:hypothetical protein
MGHEETTTIFFHNRENAHKIEESEKIVSFDVTNSQFDLNLRWKGDFQWWR